MSFTVKTTTEVDIEIELNEQELPHCCGVIVLGKIALEALDDCGNDYELTEEQKAEALAEELDGVSSPFVMFTTVKDQDVEIAALTKAGFTAVDTFVNKSTGNVVTLWTKNNSKVPAPRARRARPAARTARRAAPVRRRA